MAFAHTSDAVDQKRMMPFSPPRSRKSTGRPHQLRPRALTDRDSRVAPGRASVLSVSHILVTGMSGAGKTTLLDELRRRGHHAVDTDYDGWTLRDGTWDEPRMAALLANGRPVIVSGTVENQVKFYDNFDAIVLLSAPLSVLLERVSARVNNPYGTTREEREEISRNLRDVEPLLRAVATLELDGRETVSALADRIEAVISETGSHLRPTRDRHLRTAIDDADP